MAILHSAYQIPALPEYSAELGNLIRALLTNEAHLRPNIVQLVWMVGDLLEIPRENIKVEDLYSQGEYTSNVWKVAQFVPCQEAAQMQDVELTLAQYQQFCFVEYRKSVALQQKNQQVMAYNYQLQMLYQGACAPPAPPAVPVMIDAAGNAPPCAPPAHPVQPPQLPPPHIPPPHIQAPRFPPPPDPVAQEPEPVTMHLSGGVPSSSSLPSLAGTGESHNPWKKEAVAGNPWQGQLEKQDALIELEDPVLNKSEIEFK